MIYTYKNIDLNLARFEVTGVSGLFEQTKTQEYFCQDLSLTLNAALDKQFSIDDKFVKNYIATEGIKGALSFSYYLTGKDLIREFFSNDKAEISGNLAGLNFTKGKVENYSLSAKPNSPIIVSATVIFFDQLSGNFKPVFKQAPEVEVSNYYNTTFENFSPDILGSDFNIFNFNYTFSNEVSAIYRINSGIGATIPSEIRIGKKQATLTLNSDAITGKISYSGDKIAFKIGIKNFTGELVDTLLVSGVLTSRVISTSQDNIINNQLQILESNIAHKQLVSGTIFKSQFPP